MTEDKSSKTSIGAIILAALATIGGIADFFNTRAENERLQIETAKSEINRVAVSKDLQEKLQEAYVDLQSEVEANYEDIEHLDREVFRLSIKVDAYERVLMNEGVPEIEIAREVYESLEVKSAEEGLEPPGLNIADSENVEEVKRAGADISRVVAKKKRASKTKPKKTLDFVEAELSYEIPEDVQQKVRDQLPQDVLQKVKK